MTMQHYRTLTKLLSCLFERKLNFEIQWDPEKVGQGSETWNSDTRSAEHDQVLKTFFI